MGDVVLRFGRQRERSSAIQITWLLTLSSSGPAYTVRLFSMSFLYTAERACSLFRPALPPIHRRSLNMNEDPQASVYVVLC